MDGENISDEVSTSSTLASDEDYDLEMEELDSLFSSQIE